VQGLTAAGLTVDELRAKLDGELGRYYRSPRSIVTPVAWRSKRYYLLGAVVDRGAYPLDRPMTIIEAVAHARGLETGLLQQNTVELADMPRAFIVRGGKRLPVDFQKLFEEGDLSQNVLIEPGDYIYFPSGSVNEVYVLGAVTTPGPYGITSKTTIIKVITLSTGFLSTAYKQRVLVVRGSLHKPQTFAVNVAAILAGKEKDFVLEPKDIVYVADKPWQEVEDLLQLAVNAFVTGATAGYTGRRVGPFIGTSIIP